MKADQGSASIVFYYFVSKSGRGRYGACFNGPAPPGHLSVSGSESLWHPSASKSDTGEELAEGVRDRPETAGVVRRPDLRSCRGRNAGHSRRVRRGKKHSFTHS